MLKRIELNLQKKKKKKETSLNKKKAKCLGKNRRLQKRDQLQRQQKYAFEWQLEKSSE